MSSRVRRGRRRWLCVEVVAYTNTDQYQWKKRGQTRAGKPHAVQAWNSVAWDCGAGLGERLALSSLVGPRPLPLPLSSLGASKSPMLSSLPLSLSPSGGGTGPASESLSLSCASSSSVSGSVIFLRLRFGLKPFSPLALSAPVLVLAQSGRTTGLVTRPPLSALPSSPESPELSSSSGVSDFGGGGGGAAAAAEWARC